METLAERLAVGLVERLRAVVPQHILLTSEYGGVTVADPSRRNLWCHIGVDAIVEQDGDPRELALGAAVNVLSGVQDFIAEATTDPWPAQGHEMPSPAAVWVEQDLHLFYGNQEAPVLRLMPLRLDPEPGGEL